DVIGVISPASSPDDFSKLNKGVDYLEKLGYRVEFGKNVGKERGFLAGEDEQRLEDIHDMFKNKQVKAIFTIRGGYGSPRLLDKINYNIIKKNPKIFVGYSDITALQLSFYHKAGLITFGGPMIAVDFWDEISEYTEEIFWRTITSTKKIGKLQNPNEEKFYVLNKGRGEGRILGGNLSIMSAMVGTDYFPNFRDKILLLEEVNEPPYKIDRMFNHLKLAKVFRDSKGIILGRFVNCYESDKTKKTLNLNEVIVDYFNDNSSPVIYNVKHGHIKENITIPYGAKCKVNASRGFVEITESAVS
ncbi:MAG: LD-carboxypeptidase, partial [Melioribacteraceae bacterium]|nr:LD-carboxypeptidase [Melioribacteraceae bacterium]